MTIIAASQERCFLRAPGLYGVRVDRVALGGPAVVADHGEWFDPVLCYLSSSIDDTELLMYSLELPGAVPGVPLPVPAPSDPDTVVQQLHTHGDDRVRWVERICHGGGEPDNGRPYGRSVLLRLPSAKQRGYPADPEPLWDRLRAALDGPNTPEDGPDLMIGAVARPFWDGSGPAMPDGANGPRIARGPWWFPVAWYRFLAGPADQGGAGRPAEAAAWLRWLDRLAAEAGDADDRGWAPHWDREEGIERFARTHLRRQARSLAAACRTGGSLPLLGDYRGKLQGTLPVTAYPPGFARAWRRLPDRFRPA
ncbi:hypothetical protein ACFY4C_26885 [Actinomadura viridis]|uniref:hypothetical protein n=1 Tax=Actinomadura viridis TaxID=58110 RepID=UPI00367B4F7A